MASTTVSLSFAALPSSNAILSRGNASILVPLSRERALSSSLWATKVSINNLTRGSGMIKNSASTGVTCSTSPPSVPPSALLFDCDGVPVDTEKDGHRISFNDTFGKKGLGVTWDVDLYGELLAIGCGKERMTAYFNKTGWPENAPNSEEERKEFIASLHKRKTEPFMALIEKRLLPLRPGVTKAVSP